MPLLLETSAHCLMDFDANIDLVQVSVLLQLDHQVMYLVTACEKGDCGCHVHLILVTQTATRKLSGLLAWKYSHQHPLVHCLTTSH